MYGWGYRAIKLVVVLIHRVASPSVFGRVRGDRRTIEDPIEPYCVNSSLYTL